jgi:hypothetical protein
MWLVNCQFSLPIFFLNHSPTEWHNEQNSRLRISYNLSTEEEMHALFFNFQAKPYL